MTIKLPPQTWRWSSPRVLSYTDKFISIDSHRQVGRVIIVKVERPHSFAVRVFRDFFESKLAIMISHHSVLGRWQETTDNLLSALRFCRGADVSKRRLLDAPSKYAAAH